VWMGVQQPVPPQDHEACCSLREAREAELRQLKIGRGITG
jgi:hypothetical protein